MYFQHEYERERVTMAVGQTYKLDLPENGLLGSIMLRVAGTEVGAYGADEDNWRLIDEISKITILANGATVVKSLSGRQLQGLSVFDQGVFPPSIWRNYATNEQRDFILINFGRELYDLDYGLDLSRFKNIEIQITNTGSATSFTSLQVTILGVYLQDAPSGQFKGFLRTEEWRSWTTVQNAIMYLDLPTEHVIRRVILQALPNKTTTLEDTKSDNLMYDIDMSLDTGQKRVYKGGFDDLSKMNFYHNGKPLISAGLSYATAGYGVEVDLGRVYGGAAVNAARDDAVSTSVITLNGGQDGGVMEFEDYEGDTMRMFAFLGVAPFHCVTLNFDVDKDPATWLDPARRGTVELNIQTADAAAAADGSNHVILDRLVRY